MIGGINIEPREQLRGLLPVYMNDTLLVPPELLERIRSADQDELRRIIEETKYLDLGRFALELD